MIRRIAMTVAAASALAFAPAVEAQTIGFKLGATFGKWNASENGDDVNSNQGSLQAFAGGGFVRFGLGRLGIRPELLVVTRGTDINDTGDDDMTIKVDYVEVPVLVVLPLSMGSGLAPYVFGGPSFAWEIGCKTESTLGGSDSELDCDAPGQDLFERKNTDVGLTAGAGLEFPLGPGAVLIEGRYNWGLTNLADGSADGGLEVKSRTAAIYAGYSIWIGSR